MKPSLRGSLKPEQIKALRQNNYYPFGLKHKGYNEIAGTGYKYKFGGKELNSELGLELYDFGARNYDAAIGRWLNMDPLAENSRRWTPYNYAYNNPIVFVDPDGMQAAKFNDLDDIIIKGNMANEAFSELQSSVSNELSLSMDSSGKISAVKVDVNAPLSKGATDLFTAVNDKSVTVTLNASNNELNSTGTAPLTGNFMGNSTMNLPNGPSTASQEINVPFLAGMDKVMVDQGQISRQGQNTLHETTEAYTGAIIARQRGVSNTSPASINDANNLNSIYSKSHNSVVPQSGQPNSYFIDSSGKAGNPTDPTFNPVRMEYWIGDPETRFYKINIPN